MSSNGGSSGSVPEMRQAVLNSLRALLVTIGSANDAEDHGYLEDAGQMRKDACDGIRNLMAEHAFLGEMLPTLQWEVDTLHILGFGWANLCDEMEKYDAR
jgi:hypothetical protein